MRIDPIEKAIDEQLQGFSPEPDIDNGIKGKRIYKAQIYRPQRKTEIILNEMADELRKLKLFGDQKSNKRKKRRRRRGPRVNVYRSY